jgi:multicomponent Na+:H+ antiporter subunit B
MIKKLIVFLMLAVLTVHLYKAFEKAPFGENRIGDTDHPGTVSAFYLKHAPETLQIANSVTAIVVNFRGFDTLGEVTVLFLAATGLASILYRRREEEVSGEHLPTRLNLEASSLVRTGAKMIFPLILLLGIYVFVHGHLTPGGGFQGGAIIATGFLLMFITYKRFTTNHKLMVWLESLSGLAFVLTGLYGLIAYGSFLQNTRSVGTLNDLISGGFIPLIYIFIGIKVSTELTNILDILMNTKPKRND